MNRMPSASSIVGLPDLRINTISISEGEVILQAEITKRTAVCPVCRKISKSKHSCYIRKIRNLPICNKATYIHLKTKRFLQEQTLQKSRFLPAIR